MSNPIKILHILPCLELGGTETFVMNNYRNIDRTEVQFDFLIFEKKEYPYTAEIERLGGKIFFATHPSLKHTLRFCRLFIKAVKEGGPYDAIHCHCNSGNVLPLLCGTLMGIKKRISHSHSLGQIPKTKIRRFFFIIKRYLIRLFGNRYLACSTLAGEELYGVGFFGLYGKVIPNGIDVNKFSSIDSDKVESLKKSFNISVDDGPIFANITRFDNNKNQLFVLEIFNQILIKNPNAVLLLGGVDAGMLKVVKEKAIQLNIFDKVRFIGRRNDVEDCLQLIDVYLFPSLYEGLGIALLEAQAAGCMCFASTRVPKEVDTELGTVKFISLDLTSSEWSEMILDLTESFIKPKKEKIVGAFISKGYDIKTSSLILKSVYEE